tara:strand:+ start:316 stop:810 length:495 start_codon:yes stop_codon:yes gene_type:complete
MGIFSILNEMEEDKLFISLMQVFIAQMDSALKISNIISEHSDEEDMSPDSIVTGLVYRLMITMNDKEMKESMDLAKSIMNDDDDDDDEDYNDEGGEGEGYGEEMNNEEIKTLRNIKKNTCNCNICARARACLINYPTYEASDQLAQKFKDAIDKTCGIHKINIV